jgi:hypothetical protein
METTFKTTLECNNCGFTCEGEVDVSDWRIVKADMDSWICRGALQFCSPYCANEWANYHPINMRQHYD